MPRVLFVGGTRYQWPLSPGLARKFEALGRQMDYQILARGHGNHDRFHLVSPGASFHARLIDATRRHLQQHRPDAVVAEDPRAATLALLARRLARGSRARVIVEVHGDWRASARLYGSRARRLMAPLADAVSGIGVRNADAVRVVSAHTGDLVEAVRAQSPDAIFPTYSDLSSFNGSPVVPMPGQPTALFVGALEPVKNIDGLARAWRSVSRRLADARLVIVGNGSRRDTVVQLETDLPGRTVYLPNLSPPDVARELDRATVLVLPSRSEGLPRVIIEAFARGRGVVATRAGGMVDLVEDGREGLLVDVDDEAGLADALVRVLSDEDLARRLGAAAHESFPDWNQSASDWAARMRELVDLALAGA